MSYNRYKYQREQRERYAADKQRERQRELERQAKRRKDAERRAALTPAERKKEDHNRLLGGGVVAVGIGVGIWGLIALFANPCFFRQFPPAGCIVSDMAPPGSGLGYALIFIGALVGLMGSLMVATSAVRKKDADGTDGI